MRGWGRASGFITGQYTVLSDPGEVELRVRLLIHTIRNKEGFFRKHAVPGRQYYTLDLDNDYTRPTGSNSAVCGPEPNCHAGEQ